MSKTVDRLWESVPRLIDEWQEVPTLWNGVKIETDKRKSTNQFILAGSSTLANETKIHSGAGRIITIDMTTLSWQKLGYSNESVSLADLLNGDPIAPKQNQTELKTILQRLVVGGWPGLVNKSLPAAIILNRSYVNLLLSDDISRVSGVQRNRINAQKILQSLARNIATVADVSTTSQRGMCTFAPLPACVLHPNDIWQTHLWSAPR